MNNFFLCLTVCFSTISALQLTHHSSLPKEAHMKLAHFYKKKNVLVTGGCGFIGSHVAEMLVNLGANVTIIDNLATGFEKNIEPFRKDITFLKESIVDPAACEKAVSGNEIIFHLAAFISVPGSVKDPKSCHEINVDGTFNLLQAARHHNVKRFVFSSTSSVYGPRETVCHETDSDLKPVSPYGATKLMGELYCSQFSLLFDVPCVMLRYFNVYGDRQNPDSEYAAVVAKFRQCLESDKPLTIFGDGTQTRDFVHVKDVAEANLIVGMAEKETVNGEKYNIGTGKSISVLQLAEDMKKQFPGHTHETVFKPSRDGDVKHTQMSAEKFSSLKQQYTG